ncbi:MAG TPA: PqqD family peptide modification chaperone [Pyrinomonadaceae bacterium]|nr:PqqD family peptide modification chaperone [Pyrinomonadaceae bacterium]
MKNVRLTKPRARKEGLIVQSLPDETLVYDLDRDLAHCLNQTAALVWNQCDGSRTTKQIARAVSSDLDHPIDENFVWLALDQLGRNHLLIDSAPLPHVSGMNRREVMRALAVSAAVAIPVVASIVAPMPAQAASGCLPNGSGCSSSIQCCSGFCNSGTCGPPT